MRQMMAGIKVVDMNVMNNLNSDMGFGFVCVPFDSLSHILPSAIPIVTQ